MSSSLRPCPAAWLGGAALGAGLMYLLDSERGSGRRASLRQLAVSAAATVRRWQSAHTTRQPESPRRARVLTVVPPKPVPDWVLAERARLEIWRGIAHPDSVQVRARDGRLTLWGPVLPGEPETLRDKLARLPGLRRLELQLTVRPEAATRVA